MEERESKWEEAGSRVQVDCRFEKKGELQVRCNFYETLQVLPASGSEPNFVLLTLAYTIELLERTYIYIGIYLRGC
jgi:hypothetical protein